MVEIHVAKWTWQVWGWGFAIILLILAISTTGIVAILDVTRLITGVALFIAGLTLMSETLIEGRKERDKLIESPSAAMMLLLAIAGFILGIAFIAGVALPGYIMGWVGGIQFLLAGGIIWELFAK